MVVAASLFLPWYGVTLAGGLVKTAIGTFGMIEAALVLTLAAAAYLIVICSGGYHLPRPLNEGALLIAAGVWSAILIAYRIFARPDFELPGVGHVGLRYGIFVALAGAALIVLGGVRKRREELSSAAAGRRAPARARRPARPGR